MRNLWTLKSARRARGTLTPGLSRRSAWFSQAPKRAIPHGAIVRATTMTTSAFSLSVRPTFRHGCPDQRRRGVLHSRGNPVKTDYSSAFKKENEIAEVGKYSIVCRTRKRKSGNHCKRQGCPLPHKVFADGGGLFFDFQTGMVGKLPNRVLESDVGLWTTILSRAPQKVRSFTRRDISFDVKSTSP